MRRSLSQRKYDHYSRLRSRLQDIYRKHIQFKSTHTAILEDLTRSVYSDKWYPRLTEAQRFGLSEIVSCWSSRINELHLVWRLGPAEGPLSETENDRWAEGSTLSTLCRIPGALYGAHFWKGTDKPYGEYKPTN